MVEATGWGEAPYSSYLKSSIMKYWRLVDVASHHTGIMTFSGLYSQTNDNAVESIESALLCNSVSL